MQRPTKLSAEPEVLQDRISEAPPSRSKAKSSPERAEAISRADIVSFVGALEAAQAAFRSIADAALSDLGGGITVTQIRLLERLQLLGESRLIDLADALAIAPSTATRLCDTLTDRELIERHRRGRDRRELQIQLTERGTRLLEGFRERTTVGWAAVLSQVPAHERRRLEGFLGRLAAGGDGAVSLRGTVAASA